MKLQQLLNGVHILDHKGDMNIDVKGVKIDSRKVGKGDMFIAVRGTAADGHAYIPKAIEQGASVIVCEKIENPISGVGYLLVENSEHIVGQIAPNF